MKSRYGEKLIAIAKALAPFEVLNVPYSQRINYPGFATKRVVTWPAFSTIQAVFAQLTADLATGIVKDDR